MDRRSTPTDPRRGSELSSPSRSPPTDRLETAETDRRSRSPSSHSTSQRDERRFDPTFENDHRQAIFETIEAHPGLCLSAVGELCDVSLSTVRHHVRILADDGYVRSVSLYGKRRYFPRWMGDLEFRAAMSEPSKRALLEALATIGPASTTRLATELDRDASTITHHVTKLESVGLVDRETVGRTVETALTADVEAHFE